MKRPAGKQLTVSDIEMTMQAGKTYPFQLSFTNPLYDPIQVRLHVQRSAPPASSGEDGAERARRPPFAVTLPGAAFPIAAFAEAWEYEDDEDMFVDEDDYENVPRGKDSRGRSKTVGILERRANVTVVGGEVVISKEAKGNVKVSASYILLTNCLMYSLRYEQFNMLVSYTYRSEDPEPAEETTGTPSSRAQVRSREPEMKTFSFYTVIDLGSIMPREEQRNDMDY